MRDLKTGANCLSHYYTHDETGERKSCAGDRCGIGQECSARREGSCGKFGPVLRVTSRQVALHIAKEPMRRRDRRRQATRRSVSRVMSSSRSPSRPRLKDELRRATLGKILKHKWLRQAMHGVFRESQETL